MKKAIFFFLIIIGLVACDNQKNTPDISGIQLNLGIQRFDEDFFTLDTASLQSGLATLQSKYPVLLPVFLENIVGVTNPEGINTFYRLYKPVFDSSQNIYKDFNPVKGEIEKAFRYVKYYFPAYKAPAKIVPVVGPMNTLNDMAKMNNGDLTPNFIGPGFLGISLQFYLGKDFSFYKADYFINNVAPLYRSRRFDREYIVADVMKVISDDLFPDKSNTMSLIEQMIEKGKRWWLLDKFLPGTPDSIKTGYTQQQLNWCEENEGLIWSYIIKNEDLHTINTVTIQTYIGEAPFTQGFSQEYSPGNLGSWIGWQIVKKFAENNPALKPGEVMTTTPKQILEEAKYKLPSPANEI